MYVCIIDNKDKDIDKRNDVITKKVLASRDSQASLKDKTKEELAQTIDIKSRQKDDYKADIKAVNKKNKKSPKKMQIK